jgi:hypothetical protein|tara:strand:+ start:480 stop:656 length:177 start_codon:yes stop_codon:yes gene_type:complete
MKTISTKKESKSTIASADVTALRKVITYYLNTMFPVEEKEKEYYDRLFHRLGKLEKSS